MLREATTPFSCFRGTTSTNPDGFALPTAPPDSISRVPTSLLLGRQRCALSKFARSQVLLGRDMRYVCGPGSWAARMVFSVLLLH